MHELTDDPLDLTTSGAREVRALVRNLLPLADSLTCQMTATCAEPVTHIGEKGYIYCTSHAVERRATGYESTRKMRAWELRWIRDGAPLPSYRPGPEPGKIGRNPPMTHDDTIYDALERFAADGTIVPDDVGAELAARHRYFDERPDLLARYLTNPARFDHDELKALAAWRAAHVTLPPDTVADLVQGLRALDSLIDDLDGYIRAGTTDTGHADQLSSFRLVSWPGAAALTREDDR